MTYPAPWQRHQLPWKLTSVAGAVRGVVGQGGGLWLWRAVRRAMAHRLAVTTETQARNTPPFLPWGSAGLASRAMLGQELGRGWAPREALCQSACLSTGPSGVRHLSA